MNTIPEILCIGMAVVDVSIEGFDMESMDSESIRAKSLAVNTGGDALNEAIVISRLGKPVSLLCGLGMDGAGEFILKKAEDCGIDMSISRRADGYRTPVITLLIDENGERKFISDGYSSPANFLPDEKAVRGRKIISLASLFRHPFKEEKEILKIVKAAKEADAIVCADIKINRDGLGLEDIKEALPYIDYLFPNEKEAEAYTGQTAPRRAIEAFLNYGIKHVILKAGGRGCFAGRNGEICHVPCFPAKAVDTTGAGDNFAAGFITALSEGKNLMECLEFASAAGAIAVEHIGATTEATSRNAVEEKMNHLSI